MMRPVTRRDTLALAGLALAELALPAHAVAARKEPPGSLAAAAARTGRRFGSAFAWGPTRRDGGTFANPHYAALLEAECAILVPENEMKWQALRPAPDRFDFTRFDAMLAYAQAKGFAVRGHNLLWHQPKWMPRWEESYDFGARPASRAERLLTQHIDTVCARYASRIESYDVVNEAVNPADGTLYETALSRAMGGATTTLDHAFHAARASAPHAQLVYNDYMRWEPGNAAHRAGVLRLLEGFRTRGVPVDALGVQSHIITQGPDTARIVGQLQPDWARFLDAVTAMGYHLVVTELDVRDNALPADPLPRDRAVADFTRAYLDVMLEYPHLGDILVWGMSDRYSWIEGFEPRPDKALRRPCPYDRDFTAKPMRTAIADALLCARPAHRAGGKPAL